MRSVQVLLSSYNGEKYIKRQIDSILQQREVDIHLLIRDDGSHDKTVEILSTYQRDFPQKIQVILGKNIGYKKSFFDLIQRAGEYDYYAFADQDDFWFADKEISSIQKMEADSDECAKLAQVDLVFTDENLKPLHPVPAKRNVFIMCHDQIYADDIFQGCTMTWNKKAMQLFKQYTPQANFSHDHWIGKVCYLLGKIYFISEEKMDYVRYENNVSATEDRFRCRLLRLKKFFRQDISVYDNFGPDLLNGYEKQLSNHDVKMCRDFSSYKNDLAAKIRLIANRKLKRDTMIATLFYKLNILFNRV